MATEFEHPPGYRAPRSEGYGFGMIVFAVTVTAIAAILCLSFYNRTGPATTGTTTNPQRPLPQTTTPPSKTTTTPTAPTTPAPVPSKK
jgi:hypothetical protein